MATGRIGATITGEVSGSAVAGGKVSSSTEKIIGQTNTSKVPVIYQGEETNTATTIVDNDKYKIKVNVKVDEVVEGEKEERKAADEVLQSEISGIADGLSEHLLDKNNPHEVTKEQVGLGNVDNTSDADKPISTATQTALNSKEDIANIVYRDTALSSINVVNNTDYTYAVSINSGNFSFIIPEEMSQGFMSLITLVDVKTGVNLIFTNNSSYILRVVNNNEVKESNTYECIGTGRKILFFRCDGYYIEALIIEEYSE